MAGARAAKLLGDRAAEKTHLGESLPQFAVIRLLAVKHHAHRFRRAFFGKEFSRLVAHLLLFVGEIEIHGVLLRLIMEKGAVIPGRREAASPESITTIMSMDSGPAPRGASRNDDGGNDGALKRRDYRPRKFATRRSAVALTPSLKSSVARSFVCSTSSWLVAASTRSARPARMVARVEIRPSGEHSAISAASFIASDRTWSCGTHSLARPIRYASSP